MDKRANINTYCTKFGKTIWQFAIENKQIIASSRTVITVSWSQVLVYYSEEGLQYFDCI